MAASAEQGISMSVVFFDAVNLGTTAIGVYLAGCMAADRGRPAKPWMWATALLWLLPLPVLALLPARQP
jgi:hypothetical protein